MLFCSRFLVAELVSAVSCLHHNRILHRDLKLENMLVTSDGHIRVADFGGSVKLEVGQMVASVVGTLTYMVSGSFHYFLHIQSSIVKR